MPAPASRAATRGCPGGCAAFLRRAHSLAPVSAKGGALVILFADDLEDALARVEKAGGTVVKPIFAFPGGRRFHFADPDGYELAVWSDR